MLLLNPPLVRFGSHTWTDVALLAIDRTTTRPAEEWSDAGPHPVFADAPEQRTQIRVVRDLLRDDLASHKPGDQAALTFHTSPTTSDAARRQFTIPAAVITSVTHELATARHARQTITLIALSPDGATDPITSAPAPH